MDTIFYPCMSYNFDEHMADNHYNCPVVAYYPELLAANMPAAEQGHATSTPTWASTARRILSKRARSCLADEFGVPKRETVKRPSAGRLRRLSRLSGRPVQQKGAEYIDFRPGRAAVRSWWWPAVPTTWTRRSTTASTTSSPPSASCWSREDAVAYLAHGQGASPRAQPVDLSRPHVQRRPLRLHPAGHGSCIQLVSFGCGIDAITDGRAALHPGGTAASCTPS